MSENDYIAEYVKEKRPEILQTYSFASWKIQRTALECVNGLYEALKKIDFSKLNEAVAKMAENAQIFTKSIEELKTPTNAVNKGNGEDEEDAI